jgi:hypothetical protein
VANFQQLRDYIEKELATLETLAAGSNFSHSIANLRKLWEVDDSDEYKFKETVRELSRYPTIRDNLAASGLVASVPVDRSPRSANQPEGTRTNITAEAPPAASGAGVSNDDKVTPAEGGILGAKGEKVAANPVQAGGSGVVSTESDTQNKPQEGGESMAPKAERSKANGITVEQKVMIYKEVVTSLLGLAIVGFALYVAAVTLGFAGDTKIGDSKEVLQLVLGLAGVVLGYYFGRVPADARAAQSQERADAATAHSQDVAAEADDLAKTVEDVSRSIAAAGAGGGQRGDATRLPGDLVAQLQEVSDNARKLARRARRVP